MIGCENCKNFVKINDNTKRPNFNFQIMAETIENELNLFCGTIMCSECPLNKNNLQRCTDIRVILINAGAKI